MSQRQSLGGAFEVTLVLPRGKTIIIGIYVFHEGRLAREVGGDYMTVGFLYEILTIYIILHGFPRFICKWCQSIAVIPITYDFKSTSEIPSDVIEKTSHYESGLNGF